MKNSIFLLSLVFFISCSKKNYEIQKPTVSNTDDSSFIITGIVSDDFGTLAGATITIKGTKRGTITDFDGNFSIKVKKNDIVEVSFTGMKTKEVIINENIEKYNIILDLNENNENLIIKAAKPVIYLYPEEKTEITIKLDYKGKIETTFPKYIDNWQVLAYPDGKIFDLKTKRFYSSLFWDGIAIFDSAHYDYKDGFVVKKEDLTSFFIDKLEQIGLNNIETNEFIQYWLPILERSEYNFIHFWLNDNYNNTSKHVVTPKPDSEIRLFMEFYKLEEPIIIKEQQFKKISRNGFTFIEWGGSDVSSIKTNKILK